MQEFDKGRGRGRRMLDPKKWHRAEHTDTRHLDFKIDATSYEWLEREARRTGLDVELVACALLRKSCAEETKLGVIDANP